MRALTVILVFVAGSAVAAAPEADSMKAFPPAEEGMVRYVLQVPKQDDEAAFKLELIVGKVVKVDDRNRFFFGGKIKEETIEGWGFPRFVVKALGPMAGTLIAVDPNAPQVERFITVGGGPHLVRYNSRVPVVVYVPVGVEVRYRVWQAKPEVKTMEQG